MDDEIFAVMPAKNESNSRSRLILFTPRSSSLISANSAANSMARSMPPISSINPISKALEPIQTLPLAILSISSFVTPLLSATLEINFS